MNDDNFLAKFGKKVEEIRKSKGLSQEDLAKMLETHRTAISRIELGKINCSITMLRNLADKLEVKMSDIIMDL